MRPVEDTVMTADEFYALPKKPQACLRDARRVISIDQSVDEKTYSVRVSEWYGENEVDVTNLDIMVDTLELEEILLEAA